jgi:Tol biopolymer transport system component
VHLRWLCRHDPDDLQWQRRLEAIESAPAKAARFASLLVRRFPSAVRLDLDVPNWGTWSVSPDGRQVAFDASEANEGASSIRIAKLPGGGSRELLSDAFAPAWSPGEGNWIAFQVWKKGDYEVWLTPTGGGAATKAFDGSIISWSADAKTIYCWPDDRIAGTPRRIVAVDRESGKHEALITPEGAALIGISPDGKKLSQLRDGNVLIIDRQSGKALQSFPDSVLCWSPDSKQIVYGSEEKNGLWLLDVETGRKVRVIEGPLTNPAWSGDGSKFCFEYSGKCRKSIWIIDAKELAKLKPEER